MTSHNYGNLELTKASITQVVHGANCCCKRTFTTNCIVSCCVSAVQTYLNVEVIKCSQTLGIFLVNKRAIGGELHADAVIDGVFNDLKEIAAHHWLTTTNVDVKHLQVPQFVEYCFCLFCVQFMRITLATAGQTVDTFKVACIGEFPCQADGCIKTHLHLVDKAFSGHE